MNKDLYELIAEVIGISKIISGLSNQLDNSQTDSLMIPSLQDALFGVSRYLDRITEDLIELDNREARKARSAS